MVYLGISYVNNFPPTGPRTEVFPYDKEIIKIVRRFLEMEEDRTISDVKLDIFKDFIKAGELV